MNIQQFAQSQGLASQVQGTGAIFRTDIPTEQLMNAAMSQHYGTGEINLFATQEQTNPLLAEAMWAYRNPNGFFIAEQVAPVVQVNSLTGDVPYIEQSAMFNIPKVKVGNEQIPNQVTFSRSLDTYDLTGNALSTFLPATKTAQAVAQWGSKAKWREVNAKILMAMFALWRESETATLYQADTSYASGFYSTASPLWSASNGTPVNNFNTAVDTLLTTADGIVMGNDVFRALTQSNDVTGRSTITNTDINQTKPKPNEQALSNLFDGLPIYVGRAKYNSTPDEASMTSGFIWANYFTVGALTTTLGGAEMSPAFIKTFQLTDGALGFGSRNGMTYRSVPEGVRGGMGGELLIAVDWREVKVVANMSAYKYKGV